MKITNKLNLPQPFVDACYSGDRNWDDRTYSVTELLKGTTEILLSRRHDAEMEDDVADRVWAIFGSAVHSIIEKGRETDTQLKENRVYETFDGYRITGQFDLYDDATGTVTDYKTASVWKVIYDEWDDYRRQLLAYCWILRQYGFDARNGQIVALLKDHSKTKAKREAGYPPYPVYVRKFKFTDDDFYNFGIWLRAKLADIEDKRHLTDDELPACLPEERWHRPGKYAVMKKGRKKALKLYDDMAQASIHALEVGGYVEGRPGTDAKCEDYCICREFCKHWRETHEVGMEVSGKE